MKNTSVFQNSYSFIKLNWIYCKTIWISCVFMVVTPEKLEDVCQIYCPRKIRYFDGKLYSKNNSIWWNLLGDITENWLQFYSLPVGLIMKTKICDARFVADINYLYDG